ncbi:MAG: phosphoribosylglycinamide formyltransferase [Leptolyngbyaceae cyanobacterium SM1_4_3]|nr:phosphoribosylglycinamide formyltransferase [Leptolyngbyaceae cyanobacterium SM1_4_3]NJN91885.1 phosphoribosylglycinamide formyltransferase [Leptolyngbyaceae cyanobacterium SL_5_14]
MTPHEAENSLVSPAISQFPMQTVPLKLGVMASGSGSNFEAIAQSISDQKLNAQIQVLIYNNPDAKAAARADYWKIPSVLLNHRDFSTREMLDAKLVQTLQQYEVDWVIMAGWMRRVTQVLINAFPDQILNIHPSLLPSFPGVRAVEQAIAAGVKITGCTVHRVQLEVDSGPIIMQVAVPIFPHDTAETLHQRIQVQEHRIYPMAIAHAAAQYEKNF